MLMTEFFRSLCLPARWSICGIPVNALSCWHLYALEQTGNAYAYGGHGANKDDAIGLLMLCGMEYEQGRKLYTQPRRLLKLTRRYYRKIRNIEAGELHDACVDFADTCRELPEVWQAEGKGGKSLGGSHVWHVVCHLMARCNMTEADAWNTPYTRARCYFAVWSEANGGGEILSDRARLMLKQAEETENAGGVK